jgi:cardiolipin synthase (CMP-forming)
MQFSKLTPADMLTLVRIVALPPLWALAYLGQSFYLGIGLAIAGLTDVLDGPVARATHRSSPYGSQLDSVADILLMGSIVIWMVMLYPGFFRENAVPLLAWVTVGLASIVVTFIRFGRIGDLHLYSAKVAGVVSYVFAVSLFVLGGYNPVFFAVAVGLAILAATETLLVALTRDEVDSSVKSFFIR